MMARASHLLFSVLLVLLLAALAPARNLRGKPRSPFKHHKPHYREVREQKLKAATELKSTPLKSAFKARASSLLDVVKAGPVVSKPVASEAKPVEAAKPEEKKAKALVVKQAIKKAAAEKVVEGAGKREAKAEKEVVSGEEKEVKTAAVAVAVKKEQMVEAAAAAPEAKEAGQEVPAVKLDKWEGFADKQSYCDKCASECGNFFDDAFCRRCKKRCSDGSDDDDD